MKQKPRIPPLYETPQVEIAEVARDLRWAIAGCKVYFAVDSKDVIDYCFPLNPFDVSEPDLDRIAAEQTALDFIFIRRVPTPLLLPHYVDELTKYFAVIQSSASRSYEDLEMWKRINSGLSVSSRKAKDETSEEEEFGSLKKNIVRKLAVWLGIDSFGSDRIQKIVHDLHSIREVCEENKDPDLDRIVAEYKPQRVKEISDFLETQIPPSTPEHKRAARLAASGRDAMAVDWLLYLNAKCSELFLNTPGSGLETIPRYVFLYISSAPKTTALFAFLQQQQWYPLKCADRDNRQLKYNLHRNRRQILLVARAGWGGEGGAERASANIDEIEMISRMVAEVGKGLQEACATCILDGHQGQKDCAWREVCGAIKKVELKTSDVPDLGLMSRLGQYSALLKARPRLKDQKLCLAELQDILKSGEIPDLALRRVLDQQSFAATQSLLARRLFGSEGPEPSYNLPEPLFSLTMVFPKLPSPYDQMQNLIEAYCSLDSTHYKELRSILLKAMHAFLALDEQLRFPANREHELARLLLHLAFGGESGCVDVLERSRHLQELEEIGRDPYYFLLCSVIASLQLERYVDTHRYVSRGLDLCPKEAFLYHARGVNTFSWLRNRELSIFCTQEIASCVNDESRALELLHSGIENGVDSERSNRLRGMLLNNLVFMQSYSPDKEFKQIFDLEKAQSSLAALLRVVPRNMWNLTPRYFHTEAHLEYQLALADTKDRAGHLHNAQTAVKHALDFRPNQRSYSALLKDIEAAIEKLPSKHPISR